MNPTVLPPLPSSTTKKIEPIDPALRTMGFELEHISPDMVYGHLLVTQKCCQPLKKLHGGVSALIAEGLASIGAFWSRPGVVQSVVGLQLSINHHKSAKVGDLLFAQATPLSVGKTIQVWEARIWKRDTSNSEITTLVASSRVTIYCEVVSDDKPGKATAAQKAKWQSML